MRKDIYSPPRAQQKLQMEHLRSPKEGSPSMKGEASSGVMDILGGVGAVVVQIERWMDGISGREGAHGAEGFVAGLESEGGLDLVGDELGVLGEVGVALDALPAGLLDDHDAVVAAVDAAHAGEGAAEDAVLAPLGAVLQGLRGLAQLALDAQRRAAGPVAPVAVEVGQSAGLDGVPHVDAASHVVRRSREAVALAALLQKLHHHQLYMKVLTAQLINQGEGSRGSWIGS